MSAGVCITAAGAVTAFGAGTLPLWQGLCAAQTRVLPSPAADGQALGALVPHGALAEQRSGDRTLDLARAAAQQLTTSPAWASVDPLELGICVGTTQGSIHSWLRHQRDPQGAPPPPRISDPARDLARRLGAGGPVQCPSLACASGTAALGLGLSWLLGGQCRAVVAGGVDAWSEFVHHGFASLRALDSVAPRPFDLRRAGLGLGEGAGLVLLQLSTDPAAPKLASWGLAADANHLTGPDPEGRGVARAITAALDHAGLRPDQVDFISAHGTGTRYNDRMEGQALARVFGPGAANIPVNSIKGAVGHTMGAAGALEAIHCAQVLQHGQAPPTTNLEQPDPAIELNLVQGQPRPGDYRCALSTSSGFGGVNAAVVVTRAGQ